MISSLQEVYEIELTESEQDLFNISNDTIIINPLCSKTPLTNKLLNLNIYGQSHRLMSNDDDVIKIDKSGRKTEDNNKENMNNLNKDRGKTQENKETIDIINEQIGSRMRHESTILNLTKVSSDNFIDILKRQFPTSIMRIKTIKNKHILLSSIYLGVVEVIPIFADAIALILGSIRCSSGFSWDEQCFLGWYDLGGIFLIMNFMFKVKIGIRYGMFKYTTRYGLIMMIPEIMSFTFIAINFITFAINMYAYLYLILLMLLIEVLFLKLIENSKSYLVLILFAIYMFGMIIFFDFLIFCSGNLYSGGGYWSWDQVWNKRSLEAYINDYSSIMNSVTSHIVA